VIGAEINDGGHLPQRGGLPSRFSMMYSTTVRSFPRESTPSAETGSRCAPVV
jgi:hypothetical protein